MKVNIIFGRFERMNHKFTSININVMLNLLTENANTQSKHTRTTSLVN